MVRFTLEGTEMILRLSGTAAKNFALFAYAVLKDQKKTRGKTRLVRMLKEQRPFKFFHIPEEYKKEFAREAKRHGLLYVPLRNKRTSGRVEVVAFADDAAKIQRIYDNLGLDYVASQAGSAVVEKTSLPERPPDAAPGRTESVQWENETVNFEVGGFEDDFSLPSAPIPGEAANFTSGREGEPPAEKSPSGNSLPGRKQPPGGESRQKPSVRKQLQEIKEELVQKRASQSRRRELRPALPRRKQKWKGRE